MCSITLGSVTKNGSQEKTALPKAPRRVTEFSSVAIEYPRPGWGIFLHSAKGGAVETGLVVVCDFSLNFQDLTGIGYASRVGRGKGRRGEKDGEGKARGGDPAKATQHAFPTGAAFPQGATTSGASVIITIITITTTMITTIIVMTITIITDMNY